MSRPSAPISGKHAAATSGPIIRPRSVTLPYREVMAGSLSFSTSEGSAERIDGENRAVPKPAITENATVAPNESTSPMAMNATARTASAATAHQRRDQRSTIAPITGPRSMAGRKSASRTTLIAHGEWKRSYAMTTRAT
jgi:hypothetical protein